MTSESGGHRQDHPVHRALQGKGIPILPPDVNESRYAFLPSGKSIRFGLSAVKGLGAAAVDAILEARAEGGFGSIRDFLSRIDLRKVNKRPSKASSSPAPSIPSTRTAGGSSRSFPP